MTKEKIAFWVTEFLEDSEAVGAMKKDESIAEWRVQMLAKRTLLTDAENLRRWGYLLYLHDGSSLKVGAQ